MKNIALVSALSVAVLSGCASRPEGIAASHVAFQKYESLSCEQLATKMVDVRAELQKYSDMQDSKANVDAGSVFFVLIPASAFTGDHEADVAKWKGEVEAVETAQVIKKCKA